MYDEERLEDIFEKTDGICRHCRKNLVFKNYGNRYARGGWEVDHSIPKSHGGTENLRNLWPTCRDCNELKGAQTGSDFDENFEPRSLGGKIVELLGGQPGDFGTDHRREYI